MNKLAEYILDHNEIKLVVLAEKSKVSRQTLYNLISEEPKTSPTMRTIKRVCKALNLDWKEYID